MAMKKITSVLLDLSLTDPKIIEEITEGEEAFLCYLCKTKITEKKYIIKVSGNTPYHSFINPYGFSYNVITVSYCEMVREDSVPVSEHTWFPGYAWRILSCAHCSEHLGWRFISVKEKIPTSFYGLIRDKLISSYPHANI
jgi:cereblon